MQGVVEKLKNPYEVLGIKENASEEEIKRAYREQVKKYHPDQYQDNPLSKLAEEKLREVNEAYDYLTKSKAGASSSSAWNNNQSSNDNGDFFNRVRMYINSGNIGAAEDMLDGTNERSAPWYYLKGLIYQRKGWYDQARSHIQTAARMDPLNFEYRDALNKMSNNNAAYRGNAFGRGYNSGPNMCDLCACAWCSDSMCECCGGDLIGCC